ncbi:serine/arginine repetitive matrix protein 1-like [Pseudomyrmex gracilis]|uniref:serine/arginine repetitive matrix protein 1-like n=1 Tax=Pseudomyrmex gracilis TaxID=219809 RepID=UPI000995C2EF|nr:serine/arginine repetitive matrix protein 1-like [Pseudomyrmex gracilis]
MEMEMRAERELLEDFESIRVSTRSTGPSQPLQQQQQGHGTELTKVSIIAEDMPSAQIVEQASKLAASVRRMAVKSKNLKGTFVRQFKEAASGMEEAVHLLAGRASSDAEVRRLSAANKRLNEEVAEMREKISALRGDKEAAQVKLDSVAAENRTLRAEVEALHDELRDMRKDLMSLRMARLKEAKKKRPSERPIESSSPVPSASHGGSGGGARSSPEPPSPPGTPGGQGGAAEPPPRLAESPSRKGPSDGAASLPLRDEGRPIPPPRTGRPRDPESFKHWERRIMDGTSSSQPSPPPTDEPWTQVVRRGKGKSRAKGEPALVPAPQPKGKEGRTAAAKGGKPSSPKPKLGKPPRCAAITLTTVQPNVKLGDVMAYIRGKVRPEDHGVDVIRPKRAITGALVMEVPGDNSEARADALCAAMAPYAAEKGARVSRPVKTAEMRIKGLEDSVSSDEVRAAVASVGGCRPTDIKVGQARASSSGLQTAWVQCPLTAARKVVAEGAIRVGWVRAPVEALERRPLQCHRCLRRGHVITTCTYTAPGEDRRGRCYRCGGRGHHAAECTEPPRCPLCADLSRPAAHRLGSKACAPVPKRGKSRAQKAGASVSPQPAAGTETAGALGATPTPTTAEGAIQLLEESAQEEGMEVEVPPTS